MPFPLSQWFDQGHIAGKTEKVSYLENSPANIQNNATENQLQWTPEWT